MCNFNQQSEEIKSFLHVELSRSAEAIGGTNFMLGLLEAIKEKKPNALMFKGCRIDSKEATLSWNKIVFKDKLDVLENVIRSTKSSDSHELNILESDNAKQKKKILNMVKTLSPLVFNVKTINSDNGDGFSFKIFDSVKDGEAKLNPIFVAMFFCSNEYMKKAIKYTA